MKILKLSFRDNPALACASYTKENGFDPLETLIITPSERFKSYFAALSLKLHKSAHLISPDLITAGGLVRSTIASLGFQLATDIDGLTMFYDAFKNTRGIEALFPASFPLSFESFSRTASSILGIFDEINREEVDINAAGLINSLAAGRLGPEQVTRYFETFNALYDNYHTIQRELDLYDASFLIREVQKDDILRNVSKYEAFILVSPLALTHFEKRIFDAVEERLHVLYQDTDEYDFSNILSYGLKSSACTTEAKASSGFNLLDGERTARSVSSGTAAQFFEAPSRMAEVATALSIIRDEIDTGKPYHTIAVLNIDSRFCEMLYDSFNSMEIPVNYSKGIPFKKSPLYSFLNLAKRFFCSRLDSRLFLEMLRNDLFAELSGCRDIDADYRKAREEIYRKRIFQLASLDSGFISHDENKKRIFALLKGVYESKDFDTLYKRLSALLSLKKTKKTYEFYVVKDILLSSVLELRDLVVDVSESPFEILLHYVKSKNAPLLGSYAEGIQIIGILETRGITFKTVIVPSFNEGFFPAKEETDMFLNQEMRKKLGLSTLFDREDLEFYYLKRIIDAAESSYFISIVDKTGQIDVRSRYYYLFTHMKREAEPKRARCLFPVKTPPDSVPHKEVPQPALRFPIKEYSRLDIDRLKKCETQYYIAKLLGISPQEVLTDRLEMDLVGMKVHTLFQKVYRGIDFDSHLPGLEELSAMFLSLFSRLFKDGLFSTKEEALMKRVLRTNLIQALGHDFERFQDGYRVCSQFIEKEFVVSIGTQEKSYTLKGRIDRIDRSPSGGYIIVDYKTGRIPDRTSHFEGKDYREVQLGFYGLLFQKTFPERRIEGLGYFDLSSRRDIVTIIEGEDVEPYLAGFESSLIDFLNRFNAKKQLSLTDDPLNCKYCPYYPISRIYEK